MRILTRAILVFMAVAISACNTVRGPMMSDPSNPYHYSDVNGSESTPLPMPVTLHHGLETSGYHPILQPGVVMCPYKVGYTKADNIWVSGHRVCMLYEPARFQPEPEGRGEIPVAPDVEPIIKPIKEKEEEKKSKTIQMPDAMHNFNEQIQKNMDKLQQLYGPENRLK